ncbi:MAG: hypothetical protein JJE04_11135, partial [Acidobacteriia bacterium]|nr:hypothetical protein [Terriglobia bacterium]
MNRFTTTAALLCLAAIALLPVPAQQPKAPSQKKGAPQPPPIQPTPEDLRRIKAKVDELDSILGMLKTRRIGEDPLADVEVYSKSGHWLLEFPQTFFTPEGIDQALTVLDQGIERARQLQGGQSPWVARKGRKIHAYYSPLDGSVQPYGLTVPESYDASRPARLYVWLHGRDARLSEANFIYRFPAPNKGITYQTADVGQ